MKKLLPVLGVLFLVPQIALAAWWNPLSWFSGWKVFHKTENKTQVIEMTPQLETNIVVSEEAPKEPVAPESKKMKSKPLNSEVKVTTQTPPAEGAIQNQYTDLIKNFEDFKLKVEDEIVKTKNLYLGTVSYLTYKSRIEYLESFSLNLDYEIRAIKLSSQSADIVNKYKIKLVHLNNDYSETSSIFSGSQAQFISEKEEGLKKQAENEILKKKQYVQDIKVKIAEMDQLKVQISTLKGPTYIDILNSAKKIDGEPLFYTVSSYRIWTFPYNRNDVWPDASLLNPIVMNYRAFLVVELAKNE